MNMPDGWHDVCLNITKEVMIIAGAKVAVGDWFIIGSNEILSADLHPTNG
jgi:hypothetical protein